MPKGHYRRSRYRWTDARIAEMLKWKALGWTNAKVGKHMGCTKSEIDGIRLRLGLVKPRPPRPCAAPAYLHRPPSAPPSPAMWALAEFDPVVARAAHQKERESRSPPPS